MWPLSSFGSCPYLLFLPAADSLHAMILLLCGGFISRFVLFCFFFLVFLFFFGGVQVPVRGDESLQF